MWSLSGKKEKTIAEQPGGRGLFGRIGDTASDVGGAIAGGASSAWDVLSGERDWRRQKALQEETWKREDSVYQRAAADLEKAGINRMLAGQLGGSPTSSPVAQSHSAERVGRIASLAGGILSGGVSAMKGLTELGLVKANTANTIANTASTVAKLPVGIAKDVAVTALTNAQIPHTQADTALKVQARAAGARDIPRQSAESDYYKRYGRSAVLAREIRNPWQAGMLIADQAGRGPVERATNSAASVLARQSARLNVETLRKKSSDYSRRSGNYYSDRSRYERR